MAYLEGSKSLALAVMDDRAEGRLRGTGGWAGSGSTAGAHSCRDSDAPPTTGEVVVGSVLGQGRREGRGGFLALPGDSLIKPRVHFPAQLSPARCAIQE